MSRAGKVKIGSHWKKPPTKIYDYNYNFQQGYYKPMVDHLDKKDRGITEEAPGAQTFAERVARHCPGCMASHEPGKVSFGPGHHPDHHHHHTHPPLSHALSLPEEEPISFRRKPRMSPLPADYDDGLDADPFGGAGRRGRPRLKMPSVDGLGEPDWGSDDFGLPPRRAGLRTPDDGFGGSLRSPDIDGMMRDLGLDNPLSKRGIRGNTTPDVLLGRDHALLQRGANASLMSSADMSSSMESSMRIKKRSYNLTATTERTTVSNS
ncbi:unnamed protein product [Notodromas monacha]|uniref:Uncharacterized protein n=1 Tax=Notodromas monacha TaxID=399045 RepID=A0A7R9G931_9CRUS|nr:unnamed protein product [Notodromas monacha]CAG0912723.1 unnamed protein product [Notodromas monacha]